MIRQIEKGDTKGGIIIPKDKFKVFVEFQKKWMEGNSRRRWLLQNTHEFKRYEWCRRCVNSA